MGTLRYVVSTATFYGKLQLIDNISSSEGTFYHIVQYPLIEVDLGLQCQLGPSLI